MARLSITVGGVLELKGLRHKYDQEYARQWIKTCLAQGGTPLVRTRYAEMPFGYYSAVVVCYGGIGPEMTEVWEDMPKELWEALDKGKDDLKILLRYIAPDILHELSVKFDEEHRKLLRMQFEKGFIKV